MPGPWAQVNICQSVFAAKSPNLMSAKCTTVTVCQEKPLLKHLFIETYPLHGIM